jgi:hypothetical protein
VLRGLAEREKSGGPEYVGDAVAMADRFGVPDGNAEGEDAPGTGVPEGESVGRGSREALPPPCGRSDARRRAPMTRRTRIRRMNG